MSFNPSSPSLSPTPILPIISTDQEMIVYGVLYLILSTPILPIQAVVMIALHNKENTTKNATFKLMNLLNSLEILHVICHFLSAFFLFYPELTIEYRVGVRVIGAILNTFWIAELPIMALLAVSRIFIFRGTAQPENLAFSAKIALFLILSWMLFVLITGAITRNFEFYPPCWQYDVYAPYATVFVKLEIITVPGSLCIAYCSYLVVIYLIYMKKQGRSVSTSTRSNEKSILFQYTFTVSYIALFLILWHFGTDWFNLTSSGALAFINCVWIGGAYISPVTLMIFNNSIRKESWRLIRCDSDKQMSMTFVTSRSASNTNVTSRY